MTTPAPLQEALDQAVATGKAGTIVSARLFLQLPDAAADLESAAAVLTETAGTLMELVPGWLTVRRHASASHLSLLLHADSGPLVSVSVTGGVVESVELVLVVIGNHGLIRLEGAELAAEMGLLPGVFDEAAEEWREPITQALAEGAAVRFG